VIAFRGLLHGRVVIKYGTNALSRVEHGKVLGLDRERICGIAQLCCTLYNSGVEPILISSGAVVAGMAQAGTKHRPTERAALQDLATDGQLYLFLAYAEAFAQQGMGLRGPLLVTHHTFRTPQERGNLLERVERGLADGRIPAFNTNDALTNEEIVPKKGYRFTDNDLLAAYVAVCCKAPSLIIVSEEGVLGTGGGKAKRKALKLAEKNGVHTNLGMPVSHSDLEAAVEML
jgi:glutamate 5-kinase